MAKKIIGIIGMGSIGTRHAENIQNLGHNFVFHDPAKTAGFGMERVLADDVDAVVIASPTNLHSAHILAVRNANKPCLVEKPIAHSISELDHSGVTMVGYNLRFHNCVKAAKEWIDAGLVGNPLWANFTCAQYSAKPTYLREGVITCWSHELDLALYLLGPAEVLRASARVTDGCDDMADILLEHSNGCHSAVHLDYLTKPEVRQSIIVGQNATVIMDLVNRNAWLRSPDGEIIDHHQGEDSFDENYVEEMQAFLARIDGKQTIGCTGEEGLKVLEICLEARKQAGLA